MLCLRYNKWVYEVVKTVVENRRAKFDYFVLEEYEAGIVLFGSEVKSIRQGKVSISEAYVYEKNGEMWVQGMHISEFSGANRNNHDPKRHKKLLLHKRQIARLCGCIRTAGATAVPLSVYFNQHGLIKVAVAVVKGKKQVDKRESIKKRDWERQKASLMKQR